MIADEITIERPIWASQKERLRKALADATETWNTEVALMALTCSGSDKYTKEAFVERLVEAVVEEGLLAK